MLLPIKIALSILEESSKILLTTIARLSSFSSTRERIRMRLTVVSAVSAEEKNADKIIRIKITISCMASLGSNTNQLLFYTLYFNVKHIYYTILCMPLSRENVLIYRECVDIHMK